MLLLLPTHTHTHHTPFRGRKLLLLYDAARAARLNNCKVLWVFWHFWGKRGERGSVGKRRRGVVKWESIFSSSNSSRSCWPSSSFRCTNTFISAPCVHAFAMHSLLFTSLPLALSLWLWRPGEWQCINDVRFAAQRLSDWSAGWLIEWSLSTPCVPWQMLQLPLPQL